MLAIDDRSALAVRQLPGCEGSLLTMIGPGVATTVNKTSPTEEIVEYYQ